MRNARETEVRVELPAFSGRGEVYSWSVISRDAAPEGFVDIAPYPVAIVRLGEGPLVTAMLTDVDNGEIYIGMEVESVTRLLYTLGDKGLIVYGYKFRPVLPRTEKTLEQIKAEIEADTTRFGLIRP